MSIKRKWNDVKDSIAGAGNNARMHDPSTTRFDWRAGNPVLIDKNAPPLTFAQEYYAQGEAAKLGLKASEAVDVMSIPVRFRDMKHRGKLRETHIKCSLLRRIIEQPGRGPRRDGIGHESYTYAMAFLCAERVAMPNPTGASGYCWAEAFRHIHQRASWLLELASRAGEIRRVPAVKRYAIER